MGTPSVRKRQRRSRGPRRGALHSAARAGVLFVGVRPGPPPTVMVEAVCVQRQRQRARRRPCAPRARARASPDLAVVDDVKTTTEARENWPSPSVDPRRPLARPPAPPDPFPPRARAPRPRRAVRRRARFPDDRAMFAPRRLPSAPRVSAGREGPHQSPQGRRARRRRRGAAACGTPARSSATTPPSPAAGSRLKQILTPLWVDAPRRRGWPSGAFGRGRQGRRARRSLPCAHGGGPSRGFSAMTWRADALARRTRGPDGEPGTAAAAASAASVEARSPPPMPRWRTSASPSRTCAWPDRRRRRGGVRAPAPGSARSCVNFATRSGSVLGIVIEADTANRSDAVRSSGAGGFSRVPVETLARLYVAEPDVRVAVVPALGGSRRSVRVRRTLRKRRSRKGRRRWTRGFKAKVEAGSMIGARGARRRAGRAARDRADGCARAKVSRGNGEIM